MAWKTSNPTTREVGNAGNTSFTWDDLRFPASATKLDPTNPPTATLYKGSQVLSFASNPNQKIYFLAQLPHGYKLGTDLDAHIHYVLPTDGAGAGVENIKFDVTYTWSDIFGEFPAETTITATADVQNSVNDTHYLLDIGDILASNAAGDDGVSGMLLCSLTRDTGVANDYASAVYLLEIDFHYRQDTIGSLQEYSKT